MTRRFAFVMAAALAVVVGCSGYRYVHRTQTGGTIALQGDRNAAMEKAKAAMSQHCGGTFTVVEEGEAVVGEDTYAREDTHTDKRGDEHTSAGASTRQATEWRVTYVCGAVAPTPAPPPPAGEGGSVDVPATPGPAPGTY